MKNVRVPPPKYTHFLSPNVRWYSSSSRCTYRRRTRCTGGGGRRALRGRAAERGSCQLVTAVCTVRTTESVTLNGNHHGDTEEHNGATGVGLGRWQRRAALLRGLSPADLYGFGRQLHGAYHVHRGAVTSRYLSSSLSAVASSILRDFYFVFRWGTCGLRDGVVHNTYLNVRK